MRHALVPLLAALALAACQTTPPPAKAVGKGDINVFEIPPELSRIVLPEGYVADKIEVAQSGKYVDEVVHFLESSIRFSSVPARYVVARTEAEFTESINLIISGFGSTYRIPATLINLPNAGPGFYAVTEDSTELCLFSITVSGGPTILDSKLLYDGELFVTLCSRGQTLAKRPNFINDSLAFIEKIVIREPDVDISRAAN